MVNVHPKAAHCVAREAQVIGATIDGQSTAIAQHAVRDGRTRGRQGVRYSSRAKAALCKYRGACHCNVPQGSTNFAPVQRYTLPGACMRCKGTAPVVARPVARPS